MDYLQRKCYPLIMYNLSIYSCYWISIDMDSIRHHKLSLIRSSSNSLSSIYHLWYDIIYPSISIDTIYLFIDVLICLEPIHKHIYYRLQILLGTTHLFLKRYYQSICNKPIISTFITGGGTTLYCQMDIKVFGQIMDIFHQSIINSWHSYNGYYNL